MGFYVTPFDGIVCLNIYIVTIRCVFGILNDLVDPDYTIIMYHLELTPNSYGRVKLIVIRHFFNPSII
jgi:hypothetical protein